MRTDRCHPSAADAPSQSSERRRTNPTRLVLTTRWHFQCADPVRPWEPNRVASLYPNAVRIGGRDRRIKNSTARARERGLAAGNFVQRGGGGGTSVDGDAGLARRWRAHQVGIQPARLAQGSVPCRCTLGAERQTNSTGHTPTDDRGTASAMRHSAMRHCGTRAADCQRFRVPNVWTPRANVRLGESPRRDACTRTGATRPDTCGVACHCSDQRAVSPERPERTS